MITDSWFELISPDEQGIEQGDIFYSCPVIFPSLSSSIIEDILNTSINIDSSNVEIETKIVENDIIVLSQSCDIDIHHPKLTTILVSKIIPLEDFLKEKTKKSREKEIKSLKRRERPNLLLLTLGLDNSSKWILVDFHECYGVPYEYLKNKTHPRYRLKSPYKEYLAQSFAFYMMRVALPMDINEKVIIELLEKGK